MALPGVPPGMLIDGDGSPRLTFKSWLTALLQQVNRPITPVPFAQLPANPVVGTIVPVTDANSAVWGVAIIGGGAHQVLVWWNGAHWTVIGS